MSLLHEGEFPVKKIAVGTAGILGVAAVGLLIHERRTPANLPQQNQVNTEDVESGDGGFIPKQVGKEIILIPRERQLPPYVIL